MEGENPQLSIIITTNVDTTLITDEFLQAKYERISTFKLEKYVSHYLINTRNKMALMVPKLIF